MQDFGQIIKRPDGSYVITHNGLPYHVPNEGGWVDGTEPVQWADVNAYALANPDMVEMEQPPAPPSPAELAEMRRAEIQVELDAIDRQSVRPLRAIAKGVATQEDTAKLAALEARAEELRAEYNALKGA